MNVTAWPDVPGGLVVAGLRGQPWAGCAGLVVITDKSTEQEITSWWDQSELTPYADQEEGYDDDGYSIVPSSQLRELLHGRAQVHVVFVVDQSGSMRKKDIHGYESRTHAVYDCIEQDFVQQQLSSGVTSRVAVSLIEFSDDAQVVLRRHPVNPRLQDFVRQRKTRRAQGHGNYLPALDALESVLDSGRADQEAEDAAYDARASIVFMSDGAPSDHECFECEHGVQVWRVHWHNRMLRTQKLREGLHTWWTSCATEARCRKSTYDDLLQQLKKKMRELGRRLPSTQLKFTAVGFGSPTAGNAAFHVLQQLSAAVPGGQFQKLGLSAKGLSSTLSAFSWAVSTSATSLVEIDGAAATSTPFQGRQREPNGIAARARYNAERLEERLQYEGDWDVYAARPCSTSAVKADGPGKLSLRDLENIPKLRSKRAYEHRVKYMMGVPFLDGANAIAIATSPFARGSERDAFQCVEIQLTKRVDPGRREVHLHREPIWPLLVVKEPLRVEDVQDPYFQESYCTRQAHAARYASRFNRAVQGKPSWNVHFVPCWMYEADDPKRYSQASGVAKFVGEERLEGRFLKWNNNAGHVRQLNHCITDAIVEDDEESVDDCGVEDIESVPQAFSHFTFENSNQSELVCDLQGVWNATDGFTLTDPAILSRTRGRRYGRTDTGIQGMRKFFDTHRCGFLCRRLGLNDPATYEALADRNFERMSASPRASHG
eukprot:scaffold1565_cov215-Prasinococcus_capsulatus_cf.AAC.2